MKTNNSFHILHFSNKITPNQLYLIVVLLNYIKNAGVLYGTKYDIDHMGGVVWYHRGSSCSIRVLRVVFFPYPIEINAFFLHNDAHPPHVYVKYRWIGEVMRDSFPSFVDPF